MPARYTKYNIPNTSAYTLIELLVVLTIIGLLFAIGYANFRSYSQRQAVLDTNKQIQGDLRLAQQMALSGQLPDDNNCLQSHGNSLSGYSFVVIPSSSEYEIVADCTGPGMLAPYKDVDLPSGLSITMSSAQTITPANTIVFNVLGNGTNIPANDDGTDGTVAITITQAGTGNQSTVTVYSGGQIQ
jgi:prepilin-type N-terminal cleavage/methylation domain-containing protein